MNMEWWQWGLVVVMPLAVVGHVALMVAAKTPEQQQIRYYSITFGLGCAAIAALAFGVTHEIPPLLSSIIVMALYGGACPAARTDYLSSLTA